MIPMVKSAMLIKIKYDKSIVGPEKLNDLLIDFADIFIIIFLRVSQVKDRKQAS
jgi:hypothetical protein